MGLLRKAAGTGARGPTKDSSHEEASTGRDRQSSGGRTRDGRGRGGGLLNRTLQALASGQFIGETAAPAAPFPGLEAPRAPVPSGEAFLQADEAAQRITSEVSSLGDGVELPSSLFTALKKNLSILKGALLLYDPARLEYAPWASVGYDQTTLHRLRISLGANETFNALANGKPLIVTEEEKKKFQPFFSSREFSLANRIVLSPFISEETLSGVLLVTSTKQLFKDDEQMLQCLEQVSAAASPLVHKARGKLARPTGVRAVRPAADTAASQITQLVNSLAARGRKLLFASVSIAGFRERILSSHEDLEPFRLTEDVRYFLDCFLADQGSAVTLGADLFLVCLQDFPRANLDLFAHQLGLYLGSLFESDAGTFPAAGVAVKTSRLWPDEGSDVGELLAFLSS